MGNVLTHTINVTNAPDFRQIRVSVTDGKWTEACIDWSPHDFDMLKQIEGCLNTIYKRETRL